MNTNYLEGMACPSCGSEGPFDIIGMSTFRMYDNGASEHTNVDFDYPSPCHCASCDFDGKVLDFHQTDPDRMVLEDVCEVASKICLICGEYHLGRFPAGYREAHIYNFAMDLAKGIVCAVIKDGDIDMLLLETKVEEALRTWKPIG